MTIREYLINHAVDMNREELECEYASLRKIKSKEFGAPEWVREELIKKREKRIKCLKVNGNISGIGGKSKDPEVNKIFNEKLTSVRIVRKQKGVKTYYVFNNNIWLIPQGAYFSVLKRLDTNYIVESLEVI